MIGEGQKRNKEEITSCPPNLFYKILLTTQRQMPRMPDHHSANVEKDALNTPLITK